MFGLHVISNYNQGTTILIKGSKNFKYKLSVAKCKAFLSTFQKKSRHELTYPKDSYV